MTSVADLDELLDTAQRAWPGLALDAAVFRAHLAEKLDGVPADALHVGDLFLACACARGMPGALEVLDAQVWPQVLRSVRRFDPSGELGREVVQILRERILVRREDGPPRIADYSGRGPLAAWLSAAAVRVAIDLRGRHENAPADGEGHDAALASADPELDFIKDRYRDEFNRAFRGALAGMEPDERTLLRLYVLDRLTVDELARMHGTHKSTISRRLSKVREALLERTRRALAGALAVDPTEVQSLIRLLRSQIDVSLRRFLR